MIKERIILQFNKSFHDYVLSLSLVLLSGGSILSSTTGFSRGRDLRPRNATLSSFPK